MLNGWIIYPICFSLAIRKITDRIAVDALGISFRSAVVFLLLTRDGDKRPKQSEAEDMQEADEMQSVPVERQQFWGAVIWLCRGMYVLEKLLAQQVDSKLRSLQYRQDHVHLWGCNCRVAPDRGCKMKSSRFNVFDVHFMDNCWVSATVGLSTHTRITAQCSSSVGH